MSNSLDALINDLQKAINYIESKTPELLDNMADIATKEIKAITPVKTGRLRNSIQATVMGERAIIDSSVDYADDVEFGHMQEERFVPVLGVTVDDKFIKGSHMFENGMNNAEPKLDREVKEFMDNLPIFK